VLLRNFFLRPVRTTPAPVVTTVIGVAAGIAALVATVAAAEPRSVARDGIDRSPADPPRDHAPAGGPEDLLGRMARSRRKQWCAVMKIALLPLGDAVLRVGRGPARGCPGARHQPNGVASPTNVGNTLLTGPGGSCRKRLATPGVHPGDPLEISIRPAPDPHGPGNVLSAALRIRLDRVAHCDVALAQELFGKVGRLDRIELSLARRDEAGGGGRGSVRRCDVERRGPAP